MSYATLAELKSYLGVNEATDDTLLTKLLVQATAAIDLHTHRCFIAAYATRHFGIEAVGADDDDITTLYLDGDLYSVTTLINGAGETISSSEYWLLPRNAGPPYFAIKLKVNASHAWTFDTDGEASVYGLWGSSATPPDDVVFACIRWAAYMYKQKDAQVFDVTAQPEQGIITVPKGMPADVKTLLAPYRKVI